VNPFRVTWRRVPRTISSVPAGTYKRSSVPRLSTSWAGHSSRGDPSYLVPMTRIGLVVDLLFNVCTSVAAPGVPWLSWSCALSCLDPSVPTWMRQLCFGNRLGMGVLDGLCWAFPFSCAISYLTYRSCSTARSMCDAMSSEISLFNSTNRGSQGALRARTHRAHPPEPHPRRGPRARN
jgi:hypothetical protein